MKKHLIYTSEFTVEEYEDYLKESYPEVTDEERKYEIARDINYDWLCDERGNLDVKTTIIAIADIGTWNGRVKGIKLFQNLKDILYSECDSVEWYVERFSLKGVMHHHDGTNYVTYYEFMDHLPGSGKFLRDLKSGVKISKTRFYKYCRSAGKIVKKIYGF